MFAAPAHAATLTVAPRDFSPRHATLQVPAKPTLTRQVGVRLVTAKAKAVGWIAPPARRTARAVEWDGRIRGKRVPDGDHVVRLVYRSAVLPRPRRSASTRTRSSCSTCAQGSGSAPWRWDGTGLTDGSTFGQLVGGYGVEIGATSPSSPPSTPGRSADPGSLRPGHHGADDILRDAGGR
ncbi:MAG: hypothetical protein ACRDM1_01350 [Gaiellaceae bacterium]